MKAKGAANARPSRSWRGGQKPKYWEEPSPRMRIPLDTSSVAQSLDGERLMGSLLPREKTYSHGTRRASPARGGLDSSRRARLDLLLPDSLSKVSTRATDCFMSADVTIGGNRLTAHPLRAAVLGEVH